MLIGIPHNVANVTFNPLLEIQSNHLTNLIGSTLSTYSFNPLLEIQEEEQKSEEGVVKKIAFNPLLEILGLLAIGMRLFLSFVLGEVPLGSAVRWTQR